MDWKYIWDLRTSLPHEVELFVPTPTGITELWVKLCDRKILFPDWACTYASFSSAMENSIILTAGPAFLRISNIVPLVRAEIHGFILDAPLSRYRGQFQSCLKWMFQRLGVKRVECFIPIQARSLRRFLTTCGLTFEGRLRNRRSYGGELCSEDVYAILSEEYHERR